MIGVALWALVGGLLPTKIGALGVNKERRVSSDGVRESRAGRKRLRNPRPGEVLSGMAS